MSFWTIDFKFFYEKSELSFAKWWIEFYDLGKNSLFSPADTRPAAVRRSLRTGFLRRFNVSTFVRDGVIDIPGVVTTDPTYISAFDVLKMGTNGASRYFA